MRNLLVSSVAALVMAALVNPVQARGCRSRGCCYEPAPCCDTCVSWVEKQVTCYRPEWKWREVPCVVNQMVPREVVSEHKCTVLVPVWSEEKRWCMVNKMVPREVVQDVTCCRMVPVTCTDPCSGCSYTCCKPETYVQQVKCTVYDCVPEKKEYTVKVCSYREDVKTYNLKQIVYDCKQVTVMKKEHYCEMQAYQTVVKVPVYTPVCAPACAPGCCP